MEPNLILESEIEQVEKLFSDAFFHIIHSFPQRDRENIMLYTAAIFRRWYHTALVNETSLSPINLLDAASRCKKGSDGPILTLKIDHKQKNQAKIQPVFPSLSEESILQQDLKILAAFCLPDVAMASAHSLTGEAMSRLLPNLSYEDPFYAQFLTEFALKTGLLAPIPSIHALRAQTNMQQCFLLDLPSEAFLQNAFSSVLAIAVEKITEKLPELFHHLDQDLLRTLFLSSTEPADLLSALFQLIDIDAEKIMAEYEEEALTEEDEIYLPYIFTAGVLLDKWLFTPLGSYMGLIHVLYASTMDLKEELNFVLTDLNLERDLSPSIYSLCTAFRYTMLGRCLFQSEQAEDPFLPESIPHQQILLSFREEQVAQRLEETLQQAKEHTETVCCFRICFSNDKSYWKIIEIEDNATIYELHQQIALLFGLDEFSDFTFSLTDQNNSTYTFSSNQTAQNSECSVLKDLPLDHCKKFIYISSFDRCLTIEVEFLGHQPKYKGLLYPRITHQSLQAKQEEDFITF